MSRPLSRRQFFGRSLTVGGAVALSGSAAALLAACGGDADGGGTSAGGDEGGGTGGGLTSVEAQLSWLTSAGFAGEYLADEKGYWSDEGLAVTLVPGGPNIQSVPPVVAGRSLVTWSVPDVVIASNADGADVVFLGAVMRRPPYAIVSPADAAITEPGQMRGKRIGVQSNNEVLWATFCELNDIDPDEVDKIVAGFDPTPLAVGEADGWLSYATDEPVTLATQGFETHTMLMADFGYQGLGQGIVTTRGALADDATREQIRAFVAGSRRGWQDVVDDPSEGAALTVSRYGEELGIAQEQADGYLEAMVPLVTEGGGELFRLSDELKEGIVATAAVGGLEATVDELFDDSILDELD